MVLFFKILSCLFLSFYALQFFYLLAKSKSKVIPKSEIKNVTLSVIIPFRNEAENLKLITTVFQGQNCNWEGIELIFVNDHSTDNYQIILDKIPFQIFHLNEKEQGKKAALRCGVSNAKGDWIVTLDADVQLSSEYLQTLIMYLKSDCADMFLLPVMVKKTKNWFHSFQKIEWLSLMMVTEGSAVIGKPVLANGANFAFKKSTFFALNGYAGNDHISSGDDMFLLQKMKQLYPNRIKFIFDKKLVAEIQPTDFHPSFLHQRLRWLGKSKKIKDSFSTWISLLVAGTNLLLVLLLILFFITFNLQWLSLFFGAAFTKLAIDYVLSKRMANKYNLPINIEAIITTFLVYLIYVPVLLIAGIWVKPKWKNRTVE